MASQKDGPRRTIEFRPAVKRATRVTLPATFSLAAAGVLNAKLHKRLHIHRALITLQADPNAKARRRHKCSIPSGLGRCGVDESCALFDVDRHHSGLLRGWRLRGGT
jgi:hypothetical protein